MALWELLTLLFPDWRIFVANMFLAWWKWAGFRILASFGLDFEEDEDVLKYEMDSTFELPTEDSMESITTPPPVVKRRRASWGGDDEVKVDRLNQTFQMGMADVSRVYARDLSRTSKLPRGRGKPETKLPPRRDHRLRGSNFHRKTGRREKDWMKRWMENMLERQK